MQKVISINLNGHAYQIEESGYDAIRDYLATAERELEGNPDRAEIMADLEQAIADKCRRFLGPHKTVVTAPEVLQIVAEMGPIDATPGDTGHAGAGSSDSKDPHGATGASGTAAKRLYRIPEDAMLAGVCTGIAAYTGIDVLVVRLIFVLLAIFSGAGLILYIIMMFVVPQAQTPEQHAAAGGMPFNAQDVVDRAKQQYAEGTRRLRHQWRRQQRRWRAHGAAPAAAFSAAPMRTGVGIALLPVFSLLHLVLFLAMAALVIDLVNTGEILGRELPHDVPLWAGVLGLIVAYQIVVSPIRAVSHWAQARSGWYGFWNGLMSIALVIIIFWAITMHRPEMAEFLEKVPDLLRDFMAAVRNFVQLLSI